MRLANPFAVSLISVGSFVSFIPVSAFGCLQPDGRMVGCVPVTCAVGDTSDSIAAVRAASMLGGGVSIANRIPPVSGGAFPAKNVALLSNLPLASIGGGEGSSLYGWTDPLTRHEYAIMGRSNGTAFVDVTNPYKPIYVANLPKAAGTPDSSWREPKVYNNYVYVGVDRSDTTIRPMQVMDLTKLRNYTGTTMTLGANSNFTGLSRIHTLAINPNSGYLYASGSNLQGGGLYVMNVNNPATPTFVGGFTGDGYTHETQVVTYHGPDTTYTGREIAFNSNGRVSTNADTFSVVDVTNKAAITRLSSRTYANAQYIHQGWLTEDQRYFLMDDELDEENGVTAHTRTHLWDVSDLDNPVYRGFVDQPTTSIDHNMYVKDGYLYQTNYTTGLHVFKIGDLASTDNSQWLTEVASFDTYIPNDAPTFNGAWNSYPFFASGNVVVSDIDGGLFVLKPKLAPTEEIDGGIVGVGPVFSALSSVPEPGAMSIVACVALLVGRRRSR